MTKESTEKNKPMLSGEKLIVKTFFKIVILVALFWAAIQCLNVTGGDPIAHTQYYLGWLVLALAIYWTCKWAYKGAKR